MNFKAQNGIFRAGRDIYTLAPDHDPDAVYGERLVRQGQQVFRRWNPRRSKLCSALHCGLDPAVLDRGAKVVYLGAADGTTVSHVCDAVGRKGSVVAVEFSPYPFGHLMFLASRRKNLIPVLADACVPKRYSHLVGSRADLVFQDIAQRAQVDIFTNNCREFLSSQGTGVLALKARSVDVSQSPRSVFDTAKQELEASFSTVNGLDISRFEADHRVFVVKGLT